MQDRFFCMDKLVCYKISVFTRTSVDRVEYLVIPCVFLMMDKENGCFCCTKIIARAITNVITSSIRLQRAEGPESFRARKLHGMIRWRVDCRPG
jgi:hypothetical protein